MLIFIALILFRWWNGWIVPYDSKSEYYPLLLHAVNEALEGRPFFWNAAHFSGFPVVGDPQSLILSPLMFIGMAIIGDGPLRFDILVYLHLLIGALCIFRLAMYHGTPWSIALLAAIVFAFGGVLSTRLQHTPFVLGYAYFSVFFYLFSVYGSRGRHRILTGFIAGLMVLHTNQAVFLLLIFCALWFGFLLWYDRVNLATFLKHSSVVVVTTLLLAALPFHHIQSTKSESIRQHIPYVAAVARSPSPTMLRTLYEANANNNLKGRYQGSADVTETYMFLGALALTLVAAGCILVFLNGGRSSVRLAFLLALTLLALLCSLGKNSPLYAWYYHLPGANNFQRPSDFLFLVNFLLVLVSIQAWSTNWQSINIKHFAAILATFSIFWLSLGKPIEFVVLLGITATLLMKRISLKVAIGALAMLSVGSLLYKNAIHTHNASRTISGKIVPSAAQQEIIDLIVEDRDKFGVPYRTEVVGSRSSFWWNNAINYGVYLTQGYNPLANRAYGHYYGFVTLTGTKLSTSYYNGFDDWLPKLLGLRYVLSAKPIEVQHPEIHRGRVGSLYRLPRPYDRILNPQARVSEKQSPQKLDFNESFISDNTELDNCSGKVSIDEVDYHSGSVTIGYRSVSGGMLVLGELYNPRLRATVSSESLPIHKVNYLFQGICVPAGKEIISITYAFIPEVVFNFLN